MKQLILLSGVVLLLCLSSCEGRTGYFDEDRQTIINTLTAREWYQTYEQRGNFEPTIIEGEGYVYKFNVNGKGSYRWTKWDNQTAVGEPVYFDWTFTNDNFAVIYITKTQDFWQIEKLTTGELWVYRAMRDPVLYPTPDGTHLRFVTR